MSSKALKTTSKINYIAGESFMERIRETSVYSLKNALIPLIFGLFIWVQVTKFLSDWIYLSSSSLLFTNKADLSVFLSVANIALMVLMFTYQKTVGKKVLTIFTPSTLIGVIPFILLVLSILGVLTKKPEVGIAINLFFIFISKSLHNPILQISLHSIDPKFKARVILLLNFCISICLLVVTSGMRSMRSYFSLDMIYISLLLMGILGLILMLRFEGPYFKNLWQNLKGEDDLSNLSQIMGPETVKEEEVRSDFFNPHHYFTENYSKKISSTIADYLQILYDYPNDDSSAEFIEYFYSHKRSPYEKLLLILNVYVFGKNQQLIKVAVKAHKYILYDSNPQDREKALQIFALMEVPECSYNAVDGEDRLFQRKMRLISENIDEVMSERSAVHLRLKIFALINWDFLTAGNQIKLQDVMKAPYSEGLRNLSLLLSSPKIRNVKHELLRCWIPQEARLDSVELIKRYLESPQFKRRTIQEILMTYLPSEVEAELSGKMVYNYAKDKKESLPESDLLDLLFIREWTGLKSLSMAYILESIHDYEKLSHEERKYWKDFHLEYLKKAHSEWFSDLVSERL
jgi:hypothetical protein